MKMHYVILNYFFLKFIYAEIEKNSRPKYLKFKTIYLSIYCILLVFSFTYYGDHGLGDEANIPLGYYKTMNSSDGYAYFESGLPEGQINVDRFLVKNDNLCMISRNQFFVYQLHSSEMKKFANEDLYNQYALANNLPAANKLQNFWYQYTGYWNGWRFWLLP